MTKTIDKRIIGERNTLAFLHYLHRFGWLTTRMVAALVWPEASQGLAMARRALKAQLELKNVLRRKLPAGGYCYVLSAAGARFLENETGVKSRSGASLPLGNVVHRAASNWYLIEMIIKGHTAWTEHEIHSLRAPVHTFDGKVPDGLIETEMGLVWLEVENSWKNKNERAKVVRLCCRNLTSPHLTELAPDHYLAQVHIVGTNTSALQAMLRTFADAYRERALREEQAISGVQLVRVPVDKSLNADSSEQCSWNLWYHALQPYLQQ
ncbi:hypothetical protein EGI20_08725 [Aquitalea sp. S1-19]|nr:hypothetical protein [Aquitalea sp. S1-19]